MANLQGKLSDINMVIFNGQECKLVHFDDACTWADKYSLTIPQLPVGVGSCEVTRVSSQATLATKGKIAVGSANSETKVDIYYSDVLSATATEGHGFNAPTVTLSETNVTNNVTANIRRGSAKSTTLSWSAKPTGVASFSLVALRSPYNGWVSDSNPINLSADGKAGSQTVYFGDEFAVEAEAETGYGTPKLNVSSSFTVDTTPISITVEAGATREYQMTLPAFGPTISSVTVKKNGTTIATGKQYEIVYFKANHFDTLTLEVVSAEGYEASTYKSSWYITGPTSFEWSEPDVKQYKLKKVVSGNGVKDYVITRTHSPLGSGTTGTLNDGATLFYGDILTQSANPVTGYYTPGFNWTNKTITVNDSTANSNKEITSTVTGGGVKQAKLIISALPTGVESITVRRTYSELQGAGLGQLYNGDTIYWGDVLKATATASTGYNAPKNVKPVEGTSVTDQNITASADSGGATVHTLTLAAPNANLTVTRTKSPIGGGSLTTLSSGSGIYYKDELKITATPHDGYKITSIYAGGASITSGTTVTTGNTSMTISVNTEAVPLKLTYLACPPGVKYTLLKVLDYSAQPIVENPTSDGSITVYKGETYAVECSASNATYWNTPTITWTAGTLTSNREDCTIGTTNVTLSVTANLKPFTLTISKASQAASHTVNRTKSIYAKASIGALSSGATIYYGDTLTASVTASTPYYTPTLNWTSKDVTGNVTSTSTNAGVKAYTLTISPASHAASHTVTRTSSPYAGASTGTLYNGSTIYYGDTLTASTTGAAAYYTPTLNWSSTTVTGNVTSSGTNVGVKAYAIAITKASQAASHTVTRTSSPYAGASLTSLSSGATVYYGDTLSASVTASTGYKTPSLNWSTLTVYDNCGSVSTNQGAATYSVSIASPNATVTVSGPNSNNSYVTHFDTVTITVTPYTNHKIDSIYVNGSLFTNGGSHYVTGELKISVNCSALQGTLTYPGCSGFNYTILQNYGSSGW